MAWATKALDDVRRGLAATLRRTIARVMKTGAMASSSKLAASRSPTALIALGTRVKAAR